MQDELDSTTSFPGYKPIKTRKIKRQYTSYRITVISTKLYHHMDKILIKYPYESSLERDFLYNLVHDHHCTEIIPQAELIVNDDENKEHTYYIDCWAVFYTENVWKVFLFEVQNCSFGIYLGTVNDTVISNNSVHENKA